MPESDAGSVWQELQTSGSIELSAPLTEEGTESVLSNGLSCNDIGELWRIIVCCVPSFSLIPLVSHHAQTKIEEMTINLIL